MKLRSSYNYDRDTASRSSGLECTEPTLTQQNTAEQTDINYIVATFSKTGILPQAKQVPTYGDFSQVSDFREALELIQEANEMFNSLPSAARSHFSNDPALFLDFMENRPDEALLAKLGLSDHVALPQTPETGEKSTVT
jgi:phage internal scaffolding protein